MNRLRLLLGDPLDDDPITILRMNCCSAFAQDCSIWASMWLSQRIWSVVRIAAMRCVRWSMSAAPCSPACHDATSSGAFASVEARLGQARRSRRIAATRRAGGLADVPGLPRFVREYSAGRWRRAIAPKVHLRPIEWAQASPTRVFLLKSRPGTKMIEHTHTGFEISCARLRPRGSFVHAGGHFGPGDFDLGDGTDDHEIMIHSLTIGIALSPCRAISN